ncbi:hypothetical protein HRI_004702600 [Hibiscus trionum]|uniref:Uncharacterized protein n=1 Tax=Hibiscus trionum TaxID=183268 RepID=A0A9W7JER1_HIBTR|nr:hypothetical protein HRI_004702600 [Hibiscus trionum]
MDDTIFPEPSKFNPIDLRIRLHFHLTASFHSEGDLEYVQDTSSQGLKPLFGFIIWLLSSHGSYNVQTTLSAGIYGLPQQKDYLFLGNCSENLVSWSLVSEKLARFLLLIFCFITENVS